MSSFLWTGTTFAFFHIFRNLPFLRECLKITFYCKISDWLQIFIILINILSQPWALLGSNVFIIANISFSVTWKDLILLLVLYEKDGKQLVLSIGVHIETKKLLKMFDFLQTPETIKTFVKVKTYIFLSSNILSNSVWTSINVTNLSDHDVLISQQNRLHIKRKILCHHISNLMLACFIVIITFCFMNNGKWEMLYGKQNGYS